MSNYFRRRYLAVSNELAFCRVNSDISWWTYLGGEKRKAFVRWATIPGTVLKVHHENRCGPA
jgi:hypothetical protein